MSVQLQRPERDPVAVARLDALDLTFSTDAERSAAVSALQAADVAVNARVDNLDLTFSTDAEREAARVALAAADVALDARLDVLEATPAGAPYPGGTTGKTVNVDRPQALTNAGVMVFAYEGRRLGFTVDNPAGSAADIQIGYGTAKNRNAPATYPDIVPPGSTINGDALKAAPVWMRTSGAAVTARVSQELLADR
jgi:hypothetical protein